MTVEHVEEALKTPEGRAALGEWLAAVDNLGDLTFRQIIEHKWRVTDLGERFDGR